MKSTRSPIQWFSRALTVLLPVVLALNSQAASGIFRDGVGARATALGGADAAFAEGPLGALGANPAGLGLLRNSQFEAGLIGATVSGKFSNRANTEGRLSASGILPEGAFGIPIKSTPLTFGIAVVPEAVKTADWIYMDTPGAANGVTTYGLQRHDSEILVPRSSVGLGLTLGEKWSLGASAGHISTTTTF